MRYVEWEACIGAELDIDKWETGQYSRNLMASTIAWWLSHNHVIRHIEDIKVKASKVKKK